MKRAVVLMVMLLTLQPTTSSVAQWVKVSDIPFGQISCYTISNGNLLAGTNTGHFFCSTDDGISWSHLYNVFSSSQMLAIALKGGNVFAGTYNNGVYRSTDTGGSWTVANTGLSHPNIPALLVSDGNLFAADEFGICLTTNNGDGWTRVYDGSPSTPVMALAADSRVVVAGTSHGPVFYSTDNGAKWSSTISSLSPWNVYSIAVIDGNIFVGTDGSNQGGLLLTTNSDSGKQWTLVNDGLSNQSFIALAINHTYLFAAIGGSSVWRRPLGDMVKLSRVVNPSPIVQSLTIYPNPATLEATINFSSSNTSAASVTIFNLLGQEVARPFDGTLASGDHSFTWDASGVAPSLYSCIVRMGGQVLREPIIVTR